MTGATAKMARPRATRVCWSVALLTWKNLPLLVAMDLAFGFAFAVTAAFAGVAGPFTPLIAVALLGPIWAGIAATADRLILGENVPLRSYGRACCSHAVAGMRAAGPLAILAVAATLNLQLIEGAPNNTVVRLPLLLDLGAATVMVFALPALFALATTTDLRGRALWVASLGAAAARPATWFELAGLCALAALLLAISGGPALLLFLPAPLAVFFAAATRAAIAASRRPAGLTPWTQE